MRGRSLFHLVTRGNDPKLFIKNRPREKRKTGRPGGFARGYGRVDGSLFYYFRWLHDERPRTQQSRAEQKGRQRHSLDRQTDSRPDRALTEDLLHLYINDVR